MRSGVRASFAEVSRVLRLYGGCDGTTTTPAPSPPRVRICVNAEGVHVCYIPVSMCKRNIGDQYGDARENTCVWNSEWRQHGVPANLGRGLNDCWSRHGRIWDTASPSLKAAESDAIRAHKSRYQSRRNPRARYLRAGLSLSSRPINPVALSHLNSSGHLPAGVPDEEWWRERERKRHVH